MIARFESEFTNNNAEDWKVNIYDLEASPVSADTFICNGFKLHYKGDEKDPYNPFIPAELKLIMYATDSDTQDLIDDINENYEGRFLAELLLDSSIYWRGVIMPDLSAKIKDEDYPTDYVLKATDGFGRLKDIPYDNDGVMYTGWYTLITHICTILRKMGIDDIVDAGDTFVCTSDIWYEDNMDTPSYLLDPFDLTRVQAEAWQYMDDYLTHKAKSCYDVLKDILISKGCSIKQANGMYYIMQVPRHLSSSIDLHYYRKDPNVESHTAGVNLVDSNLDRAAGGWTYLAPLRSVSVEYAFRMGLINNLLPGDYAIGDTEDCGEISGGSGEALWFSGIFHIAYTFTGSTSLVRIRIKIKIWIKTAGGKYLTNKNGYPEWSTSSSDYWSIYSIGWRADLPEFINDMPVTFTTPEIVSTDDCSFKAYDYELEDMSGNPVSLPGTATLVYEARSFILRLHYDDDTAQEGKNIFMSENYIGSDITGSIKKKIEVGILDGYQLHSVGRLQIYNGASWQNSAAWYVNGVATTYELGQLIAREHLALQRLPNRVYNGKLYETAGHVHAAMIMQIDSSNHVLLDATYDAQQGMWSGRWLQIARDLTDIVDGTSGVTPADYGQGGAAGDVYVTYYEAAGLIKTGAEDLSANSWTSITFATDMPVSDYCITPLEAITSAGQFIKLRIKNITTSGFDVWAAEACTFRWCAILQS